MARRSSKYLVSSSPSRRMKKYLISPRPPKKAQMQPTGTDKLNNGTALPGDESESSDVSDLAIPTRAKPEPAAAGRKSTSIGFDDDDDDVIENGHSADKKNDEAGEEEEDDEEGGDDDLDEDEYIVEKIVGHMVDPAEGLKFKVKWEGYESKADQTWEPEESLRDGADELLEAYYAKHGGRKKLLEDAAGAKTKKRGRGKASGESAEPTKRTKRGSHPEDTTPPMTGSKTAAIRKPPPGSWEDDIISIDACQNEDGELVVYLSWKDGMKTKHTTDVVYRRCPQKMLRFYENHVKFVKNETAEGQDVGVMEHAVMNDGED